MTLIAFSCGKDQADLLCDTLSYNPNVRLTGRSTKVTALHHLDTAVMVQGDGFFAHDVKSMWLGTRSDVDSLDDLVLMAPDHLKELWGLATADVQDPQPVTVCLVGYSPAAERFVGYVFASDDGFTTHRLDHFVLPSPLTIRPNDFERARMASDWQHVPNVDDFLADWDNWGPMEPRVGEPEEWLHLAARVRQDRCTGLLAKYPRPLVGGKIRLTILKRDSVATVTIGEYDDTGSEFAEMVAGTDHPVTQRGPCPCGSGERLVDCHLRQNFDKPCGCGKLATFAECCSVLREEAS